MLSLGPNPTTLDPIELEESQCYEVTVTPTASAMAHTSTPEPALASVEHTATNTDADTACRLNQGR